LCRCEGPVQGLAWKLLTEPDHAWAQLPRAMHATWRLQAATGIRLVGHAQGLTRFTAATPASRSMQAAVKMDDVGVSGALVQIVDILGHQGEPGYESRQFGDRPVRRVRLRLQYLHPPPLIPAPDQRRVLAKGIRCSQRSGIEALPETGERVAKGRDAA